MEDNPKLFLQPFLKGVYSNMKEFAHDLSKYFSFRVDPFSEGTKCEGMHNGIHKVVSLADHYGKSTECIQAP